MMRWDDSASRSPRAPGSLPQGTHPRSEEPGHEEAYPGIRERKRRYVLFPVLELRLPGPEGRKCVPPLTRRRSSQQSLGGTEGVVNVVIRRDLPTGKGERPSSHTPKPEDDNRGRGRSPGIRPGKNPTNEDSSRTLTHPPGKERDLPRAIDSVSVREEGEKSRGIRKAFVRRQRRKREPEGGPDRRPVRRQGNRSRRTSHPQIQSWCAT